MLSSGYDSDGVRARNRACSEVVPPDVLPFLLPVEDSARLAARLLVPMRGLVWSCLILRGDVEGEEDIGRKSRSKFWVDFGCKMFSSGIESGVTVRIVRLLSGTSELADCWLVAGRSLLRYSSYRLGCLRRLS